jgi:uncharacterized phage-associated protein
MTQTELKILNGIKYFIGNTNNVGKTKLFKLLYFWDFEHFKRTGYTITGYQYFTFPNGPVPLNLYEGINDDSVPEFLSEDITIVKEDCGTFTMHKFVAKGKAFDENSMTPKEKKTLMEVAEIFKETSAKDMTKISHWKNSPWDKIYEEGNAAKPIDYFSILDGSEALDLETIKERFELQNEIGLNA